MLSNFSTPPALYRSMPLWVWNGEMTEARITEMLEQFAAQGMGGVFVHPRPGLITEYLSERWFELWRHALRECQRLGLLCNIYDENSYPSGFAGGHVPSRAPHVAVQFVHAVTHTHAPIRLMGELLVAYRLPSDGSEPVRLPSTANLDEAVKDGPVMTLELRRAAGNPWNAGFPMVDETHPDTAREFIAVTYEAYHQHVGEAFGNGIQFIFGDEPAPGAYAEGYRPGPFLPLSRRLLREFRHEHGYDLAEHLTDLFLDRGCPGPFSTRFDYYLTLQRLWTHNFLKPLYEWCGAHNLQFTAHFYEHEWPFVVLNINSMDAYRWLHIPAIDLLAPQFDFQEPGQSSAFLLTVRELGSVANQLGRQRALCEAHGVGGYEATFEDFKRLSDWLMVHGVNFYVQHLSYETISGARKTDHPQTFSDHSPWWNSYRLHADHVARLSVALTRGKQRNRVLVLHPTTTGWLHSTPTALRDFSDLAREREAQVHPLLALRKHQSQLIQWLCDHQVDFDLGDELLLRAFGGQADQARLKLGEGRYSVVVLPLGMENWCESTFTLIERYLDLGGIVVALGAAPEFINGRPDARPAQLAARHPETWQHVETLDAMQLELDRLAPPLITTDDGQHLPALVGHHARELEDGNVLHFLTNSGHAPVEVKVRLAGQSLQALDTFSGEISDVEIEDGVASLSLPAAGHVMWITQNRHRLETDGYAKRNPRSGFHSNSRRRFLTVLEEFVRIERTTPNALALDFCDLTVDGETFPSLYVTEANRRCWQAHNFDGDVWDGTIQFRRNYVDTRFDAKTGFRVEYHFEIEGRPVRSDRPHRSTHDLELALEHPELYEVEVNGHRIPFEGARQWLDETIYSVPISDVLQPGRNTVTLTAQPFNILCEIDRIYLLGDFALQPVSPGFRITPPQQLTLGDWTQQGLAMYPGSVRYEAQLTLPQSVSGLTLQTPEWAGSVINVRLDSRAVGHIAFPPYELRVDASLDAGVHIVEFEVIGTLKNLLGPHFCRQPRRNRWNGPNAWQDPVPHPMDGKDYEILPYGLMGPVRVRF
jgi:hypothetical protein